MRKLDNYICCLKNQNIVKREIHDSIFLINITQNYLNDKCSLYELNQIGNFIWDSLNNANSIDDITELLMLEIVTSINRVEIFNDIYEFMFILKNEHFGRLLMEEINKKLYMQLLNFYETKKKWIYDRKPFSILFELTPKCNMNCIHCYLHNNHMEEQLSTRQIIDILYEKCILFLTLTG